MSEPVITSRSRKLLATSKEPVAVIFPINLNGVNFARALRLRKLPIVGLFDKQRSPFHHTRSCARVFCDDVNGDSAIDALESLGAMAQTKPILIPTGDLQVLLMSKHRERLAEYFTFNIADHSTIEAMIDKTKLYSWGHDRFPFPKTLAVTSASDIHDALGQMKLPVVFKPRYRSDRWLTADLPKACLFHDADQVLTFYRKASELEQTFLLSEFVEGPDSNLWNTHYYYVDGKPLFIYTDQKIRQYPPLLGTGAYCVSRKNPKIIDLTEAMLSELDYSGTGAMEFKKDDRTGDYFVMEPCCCRPSHHFYIGLGEGVNLPYLVYCHLANKPLPRLEQSDRCIGFLDEERELRSAFHYIRKRELSVFRHLRDLSRIRVCVHFALRDPLVGLWFIAGLARRVIRKAFRTLVGKKPTERAIEDKKTVLNT